MIYGGTVVVVVFVVIFSVAWKTFYKPPTCFDGVKNGNEAGVDCGGSCQKLCSSAFLSPVHDWTRYERVAPTIYNVAAYVENPNITGEAFDVPYHMQIYDKEGILIMEYDDTFTLPPNRNTLAFKGGLNFGNRIPAKAVFAFAGIPNWHLSSDRVEGVSVTDKTYSEDENGSYLHVSLANKTAKSVGPLSVFVILYNKDGNAIGFSKTIVDMIPAKSSVEAPFTWPINRNGEVVSIEVLSVAE